jgi:ribonuclease E
MREAEGHRPEPSPAPSAEVQAAEPASEVAHTPKIEYKPRVQIPREEAPQVEAPRVEAPRPVAPQVDPKELLASAGLQMVETTKAAAPAPAPEPERLGRPRRERPAAASGQEELVQVETRK